MSFTEADSEKNKSQKQPWTSETILQTVRNQEGRLKFPEKLMYMLDYMDKLKRSPKEHLNQDKEVKKEDKEAKEYCFCWLPDGTKFIIRDSNKFASEILPLFFPKTMFTSFIRNLYRWGFQQLFVNTVNTERNSSIVFGHQRFTRDSKDFMKYMSSYAGAKRAAEYRNVVSSIKEENSSTSNPGVTGENPNKKLKTVNKQSSLEDDLAGESSNSAGELGINPSVAALALLSSPNGFHNLLLGGSPNVESRRQQNLPDHPTSLSGHPGFLQLLGESPSLPDEFVRNLLSHQNLHHQFGIHSNLGSQLPPHFHRGIHSHMIPILQQHLAIGSLEPPPSNILFDRIDRLLDPIASQRMEIARRLQIHEALQAIASGRPRVGLQSATSSNPDTIRSHLETVLSTEIKDEVSATLRQWGKSDALENDEANQDDDRKPSAESVSTRSKRSRNERSSTTTNARYKTDGRERSADMK
mmetsp:Transcript_12295/g.18733  ORF Transcript_12295/g.18733 Transcript_12295/m.18733 type:complete len:469 (+) Transcript_12295:131-1537(+)|eukprot:CAMPEP_0118688808 /NCGR_PEP_ID=MMETSP0800-20121206/9125_1 /TAXON_ID=210618 ORGANISM="Striatella unipunctata, Strain CCMP2910" /NCGR_SAMPLE_ID=MMETSP0800 /ASSEMBLY_ACC=CAM_ASM_000638 /LENGTH=468 /DNA_ID=CAMNT_0006586107 /DNA_START=106 /DNA_END=1512 /DNA_ORIENTATION=-